MIAASTSKGEEAQTLGGSAKGVLMALKFCRWEDGVCRRAD